MSRKFYFMRHGETDWNREKRFQGQADIPLNEAGRQQAREAGARFAAKGLTFDRVYSSPLSRASETAALAAGISEADVILDPDLLEMDYGPYDGMTFQEMPPDMLPFLKDPENVPAPAGMEPIPSLLARMQAFVGRQLAEAAAGNDGVDDEKETHILVVTHGVAIRALLAILSGESSHLVWGMPIQNCVLYEASLIGGSFTFPQMVEETNCAEF